MKKEYITPEVETVKFASEVTLSAISGGDKEIGYGGLDEDGLLEPAFRDGEIDITFEGDELKDLW